MKGIIPPESHWNKFSRKDTTSLDNDPDPETSVTGPFERVVPSTDSLYIQRPAAGKGIAGTMYRTGSPSVLL
jgi:hypothetical protein